ncbi:MAG TPA: helix-turn-helix domain-containing protein [Polyangiales bacterium]|jgi:AcrR family transcriptional regulator|nr:helix-turn-helix domain-containing protein [Polyangiales bacterium]
MNTNKLEGSARERLLAAANELFYAEGVHTVGIDRVIERAGVAKASLYSTFGSKDELVRAYLTARHEARRARVSERIARYDNARDKILAIFDAQAEQYRLPSYRGCAFINASAEGPREGPARSVCDLTRSWLLDLFKQLAHELGVAEPERLSVQLMLLYDGATIGAAMDRAHASTTEARSLAELLLSAATSAVSKPAVRKATKQAKPARAR